jgi:glycosyltransferase involved in cell wall biosynthesis
VLTVLFATKNGERTIGSVLKSFQELLVPAGGWKLIVVDNGSTDRTSEIVQSFRDSLPLTLLQEPQPGKNAALNTGLEQIEGDLVVFTDDDVFPRPDWLVQIRTSADIRQNCSVFGGRIVPRWEEPPEDWILRTVPFGPAFALTDESLPEGQTGAHNIFGPNMAVRAAVFRQEVRFDNSIGPRGTDYAMGSETELVRRLFKLGHRGWHMRDAVVEHLIRRSQLTRSWLLRRAIRFGRGQYRLAAADQKIAFRLFAGVPRYLYAQLMQQLAHLAVSALRGNAEDLFRARWDLNYIRGEIIEARTLSRQQVPSESAHRYSA